MSREQNTDWNPGAYERFRGLRLQPALDLLSRVSDLPDGPIVDLGCGTGVMGAALRARFPNRQIIGVDNSPQMLVQASAKAAYDALQEADIAEWHPTQPPALIFSNAALQWLNDHKFLMPQLAGFLANGGMLAVQMPHQNPGASHIGWDRAFAALFSKRLANKGPSVLEPSEYYDLLSPLGDMRLWETEYYQHLDASPLGHPVRLFTESTYGRRYLSALNETDQKRLVEAYEANISQAYPLRPDGSCLFPFRRLFFTSRAV